jgi:hypothetical protein
VNASICEHKDCERTDASPLEFTLEDRDRTVLKNLDAPFLSRSQDAAPRVEGEPDAAA